MVVVVLGLFVVLVRFVVVLVLTPVELTDEEVDFVPEFTETAPELPDGLRVVPADDLTFVYELLEDEYLRPLTTFRLLT